ncbi:MAG: glycosyltransferase family 2 protein [Verrucomicrobiae bacterium]|nr:glycosyltransferase family 2 protein [Verrucomicrobiae bacterium]
MGTQRCPVNINPQRFKHDLAVCLRVYPRVSGTPIFGFTDKLELIRLSLRTLKEAMGSLRVKLWALLDNCPTTYRELIAQLFQEQIVEFEELPGIGNEATFGRQIEILLRQDEAELVYFAEDDYLYLPGALERGIAFMRRHPEADFLTLYDHPDYYTRYVHKIRGLKAVEEGVCWRMVVSTCLTFMTRKSVLCETAGVLRTFTRKNSDLGVWLALTKVRAFNPWAFLRSFSDGLFVPASHLRAWRHAWRYILFGRRCTLWAPEPALATHMESKCLAPNVEWRKVCEQKILFLPKTS